MKLKKSLLIAFVICLTVRNNAALGTKHINKTAELVLPPRKRR